MNEKKKYQHGICQLINANTHKQDFRNPQTTVVFSKDFSLATSEHYLIQKPEVF
jgi:hypothetical protein